MVDVDAGVRKVLKYKKAIAAAVAAAALTFRLFVDGVTEADVQAAIVAWAGVGAVYLARNEG